MTKKSASRNKQINSARRASPGHNLLLTLTLVPLVIGLLLIVAWVLDYVVLPDPQSQVIVAVLFFMLSFAASNAVQKRWKLATAWGLLMCAGLVLLAWLQVWAQIVAICLGLVGLGFLVVEFYKQYQVGKPAPGGK